MGLTDKTPGQIAYEAGSRLCSQMGRRPRGLPWGELLSESRDVWEAISKAGHLAIYKRI